MEVEPIVEEEVYMLHTYTYNLCLLLQSHLLKRTRKLDKPSYVTTPEPIPSGQKPYAALNER